MGRKKKIPKFAEAFPIEHMTAHHLHDCISTMYAYLINDPNYVGTARHMQRVLLALETEKHLSETKVKHGISTN